MVVVVAVVHRKEDTRRNCEAKNKRLSKIQVAETEVLSQEKTLGRDQQMRRGMEDNKG